MTSKPCYTNSEGKNFPSSSVCVSVPAHPAIQLSLCLGSDPSSTKSALTQPDFPPSFAHGAGRGGCGGHGRSGHTPLRCGGARVQHTAAGAAGAAGTGRSGEVRSPRWSVSPSVWICRSGLVEDIDLPSGLLGLGSCVRAGPLGFHLPRNWIMGASARNDFAVRAAMARARDTARACRLACAVGHGRRARHPDSGYRATSQSYVNQ